MGLSMVYHSTQSEFVCLSAKKLNTKCFAISLNVRIINKDAASSRCHSCCGECPGNDADRQTLLLHKRVLQRSMGLPK